MRVTGIFPRAVRYTTGIHRSASPLPVFSCLAFRENFPTLLVFTEPPSTATAVAVLIGPRAGGTRHTAILI
jgi:hypothetical protein